MKREIGKRIELSESQLDVLKRLASNRIGMTPEPADAKLAVDAMRIMTSKMDELNAYEESGRCPTRWFIELYEYQCRCDNGEYDSWYYGAEEPATDGEVELYD